MTSPKLLTDSKSLLQQRARASSAGLFLHDLAADEVQDRMGMVNRPFNSVAVVSRISKALGKSIASGCNSALMTKPYELEPSQYDVVIHALGLHWANDPVGQIIQCRRALRPDGLFLGATFGGETLERIAQLLGAGRNRSDRRAIPTHRTNG